MNIATYIGIMDPLMVYPCLVRRFICEVYFFFFIFIILISSSDPRSGPPLFSAFHNKTSRKAILIQAFQLCYFIESFSLLETSQISRVRKFLYSSSCKPMVTSFSAFIIHISLAQTKMSVAQIEADTHGYPLHYTISQQSHQYLDYKKCEASQQLT